MRHPWERAWIYVSPHDSVALTNAEYTSAKSESPATVGRVDDD